MDFYEWIQSNNCYLAEEYRKRIEAGEKGNPDNPFIAAKCAYEAGIREGRERAANVLVKLLK